ncbi:hypothetical protein Tco_0949309 [Tanacetum coccineum]
MIETRFMKINRIYNLCPEQEDEHGVIMVEDPGRQVTVALRDACDLIIATYFTANNDVGSSPNNAFSKPDPHAHDKTSPPGPFDGDKVRLLLEEILWDKKYDMDLYRCKDVLSIFNLVEIHSVQSSVDDMASIS